MLLVNFLSFIKTDEVRNQTGHVKYQYLVREAIIIVMNGQNWIRKFKTYLRILQKHKKKTENFFLIFHLINVYFFTGSRTTPDPRFSIITHAPLNKD